MRGLLLSLALVSQLSHAQTTDIERFAAERILVKGEVLLMTSDGLVFFALVRHDDKIFQCNISGITRYLHCWRPALTKPMD